MSRTSTNFRRTAWLAIVAVLLMSTAPTVSRMLATISGVAPILMEMCTTAGLQVLDASDFFATGKPAQPAPSTMDACSYCVMTTPLPLVLALFCLLVPFLVRPRVALYYWAFLRPPRNVRGLGSQAPPIAL